MDLDIRDVEEALSRAEEYLKTDVFRGAEEQEGRPIMIDESPTQKVEERNQNHIRRRSSGRPEIPVRISIVFLFLVFWW